MEVGGATAKSNKTKPVATKSTAAAPAQSSTATSSEDELVVYEKGKVIFRMKPTSSGPDRATKPPTNPNSARSDSAKQASDAIVRASSTAKIPTTRIAPTKVATSKLGASQSVWLSPEKAEARLLSRTEPQYPSEALAAHRAGNVVLEAQVAEDGSVSSVRTLSGDPLLAAAAAEAVRNWRYQPYRLHDRPAQFQTDVTLTFALPD
jgi:protein TonB